MASAQRKEFDDGRQCLGTEGVISAAVARDLDQRITAWQEMARDREFAEYEARMGRAAHRQGDAAGQDETLAMVATREGLASGWWLLPMLMLGAMGWLAIGLALFHS